MTSYYGEHLKKARLEMAEKMKNVPWERQQSGIRRSLGEMGHNWELNLVDPYGDGDQSPIDKTHRSQALTIHAVLWDIQGGLDDSHFFSPFARHCLTEDVTMVRKSISSVCHTIPPPYCRRLELKDLLDERNSTMWLSPILMVVLIAVNTKAKRENSKLPTVMKLLLRAGASPDSKDVLGKNAANLGAGDHKATELSMELANMCIRAAKTSSLHGKDVVLEGLKNVGMNGKKGVAGGYDPDTDRRSVYIPELGKEVWIKPENIFLSNGKAMEEKPSLVDVMDRFGSIALHDVYHSDREDLAVFLIHKGNADIYIKDPAGASLVDLTYHQPSYIGNPVLQRIAAVARARATQTYDLSKAAGNFCANCNKSLGEGGMHCVKCLVTFYCNRKCQVQHWKKGGHKQECGEIVESSAGIKLSSRDVDPELAESSSSFTNSSWFRHSYRRPKNAKVGEKFVVAVHHGNLENSPLLIRDKTSTCQFQYKHTGPGYRQMLKEVQKEPTWEGHKTYMKACFLDKSGDCIVYPATARVKNKYSF